MAGPDVSFWQTRFEADATPWDRGAANPQLALWIDSGQLAPCRVLVPGCGSGYEVAVLASAGFATTGLDYAPAAVRRTRARLAALSLPEGAAVELVESDALHWCPDQPFDAVYEQTCLCALHPDLWVEFAAQVHRWLRPGGRLFALFMQASRPGSAEGFVQGPPYHCDINGMRALFPSKCWDWPKPPYPAVEHPTGLFELPAVLVRR